MIYNSIYIPLDIRYEFQQKLNNIQVANAKLAVAPYEAQEPQVADPRTRANNTVAEEGVSVNGYLSPYVALQQTGELFRVLDTLACSLLGLTPALSPSWP